MKTNLSSIKTRFLGTLAGAMLLTGVTASAATVAHYRFEDGTAIDSSGNGHNLTAVGAPILSTEVPVTPIPATQDSNEGSANFPAGDHAFVGAAESELSLHAFSDFTIEAWVRHDNPGSPQTIVGRDDAAAPDSHYNGNHALVYFQSNGGAGFRVEVVMGPDSKLVKDSGVVPQAGVWYHVAAVGDSAAGTLSFYVNGVEAGSPATGFTGLIVPADPATPWTIGRGQWAKGTADWFTGLIDEVRISDSALSPEEFLNFDPSTFEFVDHPQDLTVWEGEDAEFSATFIGEGTLEYQWQELADGATEWMDITGANTLSYTTMGATVAQDRTQFRVQTTDGTRTVSSDPAILRVGADVDVDPPVDILAHYRFEDGAAGTDVTGAVDSSGNDHDMSEVLGTPTLSAEVARTSIPLTGDPNTASVDFGGGSDLFAIQGVDGDSLSMVQFDDITLEAWVNFRDLANHQTIIGRDDRGKQRAGTNALVYFQKAPNGFRVEIWGRNGENFVIDTNVVPQVNEWYHVAAVGDATAGTLTLYVNGEAVGSRADFTGLFIPENPTRWTIGRGQWGEDDSVGASQGDWMRGRIDEVRFAARALAPHEFLNFSNAVLNFATHPQDVTVDALDSVTFDSLAGGGGEGVISYQWEVSTDDGETWTEVSGETSASLSLGAVTLSQDGDQYRVRAERNGDTAFSAVATVTVSGYPLPVVTEDIEQNPLVFEGEEFSFSVSATGLGNITYQWQEDGVNLDGQTSNTLNLGVIDSDSAGTYSVIITDDAAEAESLPATTVTLTSTLATAPYLKEAISLNFVGAANGTFETFSAELGIIDPHEVAGAVPVGHWNNSATVGAVNVQDTPIDLVNDLGGTTAATATWTAGNTWGARLSGGRLPNKDANQRLFHGYIESRAAPGATDVAATVTISNIPYGTYDVYVYPINIDGARESRYRSVTLDDGSGVQTRYMRNLTGDPQVNPIPFILSHATTLEEAEEGPSATYFRFTGLTGGSITLQHFDEVGGNNGGFAGISIVDTTATAPARPLIVSRPASVFAPAGGSIALSVEAEAANPGGTLSYEWHQGEVSVGTGSTHTINAASSANTGIYTVTVTETSDLGTSENTASASVVVVDSSRFALISTDAQVAGTASHTPMHGHGALRADGTIDLNDIGGGETIWTSLPEWAEGVVYQDFVDSEGLPLPGMTFTATGATGSEDSPLGGGIGFPIEDDSGPLLRDYIFTSGDNAMTMTVGGLNALAGREVTLLVYALGKASSEWPDADNVTRDQNDIATVTLAAANSLTGLEQSGVTDQVDGRFLEENDQAYVAFDAVVAANGTLTWTVGPVPGEVGLNAFNGFQLLVTDGGEAPEFTAQENWRMTHFGTAENTGDAANGADPDGDGFSNLLEYALGSNPTEAGDSPQMVTEIDGDGHLTLTFNHIDDTTLTYAIDATDDLSTGWTTVHTYAPFATSGVEIYDDTVSVDAASKRFLRLNVTAAE